MEISFGDILAAKHSDYNEQKGEMTEPNVHLI
jgi:hypothetical protein